MMNRRGGDERRKINQIVDRAVQKARAPGSSSFASPSTSTGGTATISPAVEGNFTEPDENGNTIHGFMLGVDTLGQTNARLRVKGDKNRYYG